MKQAFLIILMEKVLLHVHIKVTKCNLKFRKKLYLQSPYNVLNDALFILDFLNVDDHEHPTVYGFWHDGTQVTFMQVKC